MFDETLVESVFTEVMPESVLLTATLLEELSETDLEDSKEFKKFYELNK